MSGLAEALPEQSQGVTLFPQAVRNKQATNVRGLPGTPPPPPAGRRAVLRPPLCRWRPPWDSCGEGGVRPQIRLCGERESGRGRDGAPAVGTQGPPPPPPGPRGEREDPGPGGEKPEGCPPAGTRAPRPLALLSRRDRVQDFHLKSPAGQLLATDPTLESHLLSGRARQTWGFASHAVGIHLCLSSAPNGGRGRDLCYSPHRGVESAALPRKRAVGDAGRARPLREALPRPSGRACGRWTTGAQRRS